MRMTESEYQAYLASQEGKPAQPIAMRKKSLIASEHDEQCALIARCKLLEAQYPELRFLFAIPNAGAGAQSGQAGKMKAEGVKSGVPDLFMPVARRDYYGLFIEMKTAIGRVSNEQMAWQGFLITQNYCAVVCRGQDEAWEALLWYLGYADSV